jgi:AraC family transcriptional regulator
MEMRDENAFPAMSPIMSTRVDSAQDRIFPPLPNPSPSSIAPASVRVMHLVLQAMTFFESNPAVAWECLRDASSLLGIESEAIGANATSPQGILRRRGLRVWQVNRVLEYIERHVGSKITIGEIADCLALSRSHFSRAFKQSLGCSPMTYVTMRRVERAKLMMTSTRETQAAIALECGFADQAHFSKRFRHVVGINPVLWRRRSIRN